MSDIYEQAETATETKPTYATWGECNLSMYEAVWQKGASAPEAFDANIHKASDKFIRAEISIIPLAEMEARFATEWKGNVTGWNNKEWATVILPSLRDAGINLRELNGKFVKVVRKPNGKFYEKKVAGVGTGEKKELSDFLFVQMFANEDACRADFLAGKGDTAPATESVHQAAAAGVNNDLILKFTDAIVKKAAKDSGKDFALTVELVGQAIAKNAMLSGKITADSEAVLDMIAQACA